MSSLSQNNVVNPTLVLSASAQAARDFSVGLLLTHATALPAGGRVQTFSDYAGVAAAFSTDTVAKQFAATYFGQDDFTPKSLKVGVKIDSDASYTAAISACQNADPTFYGVACVSDTSASDQILIEAWCQANKCRFFFCTQESACLTPGDATNMLYLAKTAAYSRTMGIYTDATADAHANGHAAVMGFYLTTVYDQPNSIKTALMANFTGIGSSTLTQSQFESICGKTDGSAPGWNGNVYATFGTSPMLQRGQSADGRFADEGMALDWLLANVQVGMVNEMRKQRIPLTDKGSTTLINAASIEMQKAVRNGLLAPGVWTFPGFGDLKTGDFVSKGYYAFAQPVSTMSDADRAARKAPPITFALIGAGAIQYCNPTLIFQR
jgi:hypothetical protein